MKRYRTVNVECQGIGSGLLPVGNSGTLVHSVPDFASVRDRNRRRRPVSAVHLVREHASAFAHVAAVEHWRGAVDDLDHLHDVRRQTFGVSVEVILQLGHLHLVDELHLDLDRRRLLTRGALDSSLELKIQI